jgi:lipoyl(octanoyl) transferase
VGTDWRLILGPGADTGLRAAAGPRNMAVDQALLESAQQQARPALRLYLWDPACLSLGRNQYAAGLYDAVRAAAAGIDIVRRPTGGLAVLHDREITYSVTAPLAALGGPRAAYVAINRAIVAGLQSLGVPAELAAAGPVRDPRRHAAAPCFDEAAAGEVVAAGRKLVGSAQRCERRSLLQHGSILLTGSQMAVLELMADAVPRGGAVDGSVNLSQLLGGPPGMDRLAAALRHGFEDVFGTRLATDTLTISERARADELEVCYGAASWTWRR